MSENDDLIIRFDNPEDQARFQQSATSIIKRAPSPERANKYFELLAKDTHLVRMVDQHIDMMEAEPLNPEDFGKIYFYGIGLAQNTIRNLSGEMFRYIVTCLGSELKYYETRDEHLQAYYFWLQKRLKLKVDRAQSCCAVLLQAYANIKKKDPLFDNQYADLKERSPRLYKTIMPKDERGEPKRAMTEEELVKLYSYLLKRGEEAPEARTVLGGRNHTYIGSRKFYKFLYAYFRFSISGGMRASELNNLEWEDIHKDESTGVWYAILMKSKGRVRPVEQELADIEALDILRDYFKEYIGEPSGLLFRSLRRFQKVNRNNWYKYMEFIRVELKANKILDIKEYQSPGTKQIDFSVHLFRRTAGSLLYKEGMPIEQVAKWLRHKGPKEQQVTTAHYVNVVRLATPYMEEITKRIDAQIYTKCTLG